LRGNGENPLDAVCAEVCGQPAPSTALVTVCSPDGSPLNPARPPLVSVSDGCFLGRPNCDIDCPPGHADLFGPVYNPSTGCWEYTMVGLTPGCVCVHLDGFLAAHVLEFVATNGDNNVSLGFRTASETDVVRFEIDRAIKGHADYTTITHLDATNTPTEHAYSYTDGSALNGTTYSYRLFTVSANGDRTEELTAEGTPSFNAAVITEYALHQNFPNPFNPTTQITFDLVNENIVSLKVFNIKGQEVATVVNGTVAAGRHVVNFDAGNLTSGLYFYTVKIGNEFTATKKMMLVK
jgi:hypothetical protein